MRDPITFHKMHGLGNDFMVVDLMNQKMTLNVEGIKQLAHRQLGVGFDQLLCVEKPSDHKADIAYRIFNADGHEAEQCGNGARCIARFLHETGLSNASHILAETKGGLVEMEVIQKDKVRVNMGPPVFEPSAIPFNATQAADSYTLRLFDASMTISALSMGNPHAVLQVDDIDTAPVGKWGPLISKHTRFPQGTNAGFMQIISPEHIALRVYERGTGETLACGTGACAAMVAARQLALVGPSVRVSLLGGDLQIEWEGDAAPVWMTGPAISVYQGRLIGL